MTTDSQTLNENYIVVYDPEGEYWDGSLVNPLVKNQLEARGVILLPTLPSLFKLSGVAAYAKRSWGAGLSLDFPAPKLHSPLTMFCDQRYTILHWAARLLPDPSFLKKLEAGDPELLHGFLQISTDSSQVIPGKAGVHPKNPNVDVRALTKQKISKRGDFIVQGFANLRIPTDGHYGFGIYGYAPGLRLVWAAVSQAAQ
jgi:hypothetical protein